MLLSEPIVAVGSGGGGCADISAEKHLLLMLAQREKELKQAKALLRQGEFPDELKQIVADIVDED